MRIFVTRATGFIGLATVQELIRAGHQVLGLARSDAGAKSLTDAGAQVQRGDLDDLESLRVQRRRLVRWRHPLGLQPRFFEIAQNCEDDRRAIETLGDVLAGSDRPLVVTGGRRPAGTRAAWRPRKTRLLPPVSPSYPRASEATAEIARGARRASIGGSGSRRSTIDASTGLSAS